MSLPISFVQSVSATTSGSSPATTAGVTTTSHNLLVAVITSTATGTLSISDSNKNVWKQIGSSQVDGGTNTTGLFYALNITGGASHTISGATTGTAPNVVIIVQEFTGIRTSGAFNVTKQATGTGATASSGNTVVPSTDNQLIIGVGMDGGNFGLTVGAGYSNLATQTSGALTGMQSKIITTAAVQSSSMAVGSGGNWNAFVATFQVGTNFAQPSNNLRPHAFSPGLAR